MRDSPQIKACDAAIRAVATTVLFKQLASDISVMVDHAHAAMNGQITEAQNIRALQVEQQQHLGGPHTDSRKRAECDNCVVVRHVLHGIDVKIA